MLATVQLDDEPRRNTSEVGNKSRDGHLSAESQSSQLLEAEVLPEMAFRVGGVVAEFAGAGAGAGA